eukprot:5072140-Heterocapsa_arctica.AAC.1
MDFDANPIGVTVVEPVKPIPPANTANEDEDIIVDDASIAESQSGVKQGALGQRTCQSEPEDVPGTSTDINVESKDVEYARKYYPLANTDWKNADTGDFLVNLTIPQLMKVRRVKIGYGITYTILPWASNLCHARC